MATVCIMGLPNSGKSQLIEDLESKLPEFNLVEDTSMVPALMCKHMGDTELGNKCLKRHVPADAYVLIDVDPRVVARRMRKYEGLETSGSGIMKVLHKVRHDVKLMMKGTVKPYFVIREQDKLTLDAIAKLIQLSINP